MNNSINSIRIMIFGVLFSFFTTLSAKNIEVNSQIEIADIIDIAARQRMLSQRIAKDYIYLGRKIAVSKATKQLNQSIKELKLSHIRLIEAINDPEIRNLLLFVKMSSEDFEDITTEKFSLDNAQLIMDLSEAILEGSQYIITSLLESSSINIKADASKMIDLAGNQRMLAQRIAKYYIAYQSGIRDKNTVEQMQFAVGLFSEAHDILMKNSMNNSKVTRKLNRINRLWKIVYKFYLDIEKGGLPFIVFNTTDSITNKMNHIIDLYVDIYYK